MAKAEVHRPSFGSILDKTLGEVERPKPIPPGSYVGVVAAPPRMDKSTKQGTEYAEFTFNLVEALDDVDEDALKEMGGLKGKTIRHTYYLTDKAQWMLQDFLLNLGIEEGISFSEAIAEAPGKAVLLTVKHKASDNGVIYANVTGTAPVKE